jgi:hypothetical protein
MALAALALAGVSDAQAFDATGFVTPTTTTFTFTYVGLVLTNNTIVDLLGGGGTPANVPIDFNRSDTDFAPKPIGDLSVPAGRFIGVKGCWLSERKIKLGGNAYHGRSGVKIAAGDLVYSVGSDATANDAVVGLSPSPSPTPSPTPTPTTLSNYVIGPPGTECTAAYFLRPVCVAEPDMSDAGAPNGGVSSQCMSTDKQINPNTPGALNVDLLFDIYDSAAVDADTGAMANMIPTYPYVLFGDPGAAIHLNSYDGDVDSNISLVFDSDKQLIQLSAYSNLGSAATCDRGGVTPGVTVTAAPMGIMVNPYAANTVDQFDASGTHLGRVQYVAGGGLAVDGGSISASFGMVVVDDVLQSAGDTTTVSCIADSAADPPYLGYTYTPQPTGTIPSPAPYRVVHVVDPKNLFGICTPSPSPGGCGSYP